MQYLSLYAGKQRSYFMGDKGVNNFFLNDKFFSFPSNEELCDLKVTIKSIV